MELRQKDADLAAVGAQLATEQRKAADLTRQLDELRKQYASQSQQSIFLPGSHYKIDLDAIGAGAGFAELPPGARKAVPSGSAVFAWAKSWFNKGGRMPQYANVATLVEVEVIHPKYESFDGALERLHDIRTNGGALFNPTAASYNAQEREILDYLRGLYLPKIDSGYFGGGR